jgi:hypothetical protein
MARGTYNCASINAPGVVGYYIDRQLVPSMPRPRNVVHRPRLQGKRTLASTARAPTTLRLRASDQ